MQAFMKTNVGEKGKNCKRHFTNICVNLLAMEFMQILTIVTACAVFCELVRHRGSSACGILTLCFYQHLSTRFYLLFSL